MTDLTKLTHAQLLAFAEGQRRCLMAAGKMCLAAQGVVFSKVRGLSDSIIVLGEAANAYDSEVLAFENSRK